MGETDAKGNKILAKKIGSHRELEVYQLAFEAAMEIFEVTKAFPREERYSLTDQIRRSSRSVCANITEAWRRRRYKGSFVYRLNDAEAEAAETQAWLEFAVKCGYLGAEIARSLYAKYDHILGKLVTMIRQPEKWVIGDKETRRQREGETK
jgi:four helix bundle protein